MCKEQEYWDLNGNGDQPIRMSDRALGNVLRTLIRCEGAMLDSYAHDEHYKNANMNTVVFRIRLPVGKKEEFETMSGLKLEKPPRISCT